MRSFLKHSGQVFVAVALLAGAAAGADAPQGTAPVKGGAAGNEAVQEQSAPIAPNLPENQAELEAIQAGQMQVEAPAVKTREAATPMTAPEVQARMAAIEQILAKQSADVAALQVRLEAASDNEAALAIQREIHTVKFQTQIQIMKVQADEARLAGRIDQAEQIEAAIVEMTTPRPAGQPVDRPAPVPGQQQR